MFPPQVSSVLVQLCVIFNFLLPAFIQAQDSTITITVSSPTPSPSTYLSASLFESSILNSTNTYRYQHASPAVIWNVSLASFAQQYSQNCRFAHSGTHGIGENLAEGYVDTVSAVDGWGEEQSLYNYSDPGFSEQTGHFTQLVWKDTTATGCGATFCNGTNGVSGWLLVCEYYPPGNVIGSGTNPDQYFVSNVQTQTTTGQMPSGWQQTATPTPTPSTTTTSGLSVVPATAGPSATITVGMSSTGNPGYRGHSELALQFWLTASAVMVAALSIAIGVV